MPTDSAAPSQHRLKRQSVPDALFDSLRERILNGEFRDGEPLVQEAIAAEYGCSRMPVREAFRQLEAAGLIVSQHHKGAIVATLPPEQILELFALRAMLEGDILSHALGRMTDVDLDQSEAIVVALEAAYHGQDIARVGALNWEFHESLYRPAGRVQTLALIRSINVQTDRYIRLQLLLTGHFQDAERDHREILRLCRARDPAVLDFLRDHILRAGRDLVQALEAHRQGEPEAVP